MAEISISRTEESITNADHQAWLESLGDGFGSFSSAGATESDGHTTQEQTIQPLPTTEWELDLMLNNIITSLIGL
jgi:hypothetical protein